MKPIQDPASLKSGDELATRDGCEYKFIAYVPEANDESQLVVMEVATGYVATRRVNGRVYTDELSDMDVGIPSERLTVWVNVYKDTEDFLRRVFRNEDEADLDDALVLKPRLGGKAWALEIEV